MAPQGGLWQAAGPGQVSDIEEPWGPGGRLGEQVRRLREALDPGQLLHIAGEEGRPEERPAAGLT
ncbi:hypothetical protein [Deinococcus aestuarii]|uniref:hypothetical protein n=1 Tax=Deinococcus aestuarii TaxID=2774531 RepID=UPI001C0E56E2|nr:hypothetical protein [Deinococcus aestuarii]